MSDAFGIRKLEFELAEIDLATPDPPDLHALAAIMLYPDDEAGRDRAKRTAAITWLRSDRGQIEKLPPDAFANLLGIAADAQPLAEAQADAKPRFSNGCRSGLYLLNLVGATSLGQPIQAKNDTGMGAALGTEGRISTKTFYNRVWAIYRPVAHFWAAWLYLNLETPAPSFPCALHELADLFAHAEGFRILAEQTRTRQSRRSPLMAGETATRPVQRPHFPAFLTIPARIGI